MLNLIKEADTKVKSLFTYKDDGDVDEWKSYLQEVIQGKNFDDDCDALAMTTIDYAHYLGVPLKLMARATVITEDGTPHMVGVFDNKYYFGDTYGEVCQITDSSHKIEAINYFHDGKNWINQEIIK